MKEKQINYSEDYRDLRDFFEGERAVKEAGDRHTPRLEGHRKSGEYKQYVSFGILYNALARTRQGLKGAILRKPIDVQFPESLMKILDNIMIDGASFKDVARQTCDEVIGYGRLGILVDIDENEQPYVALYDALSILESKVVGKDYKVVLKEMVGQPSEDDPDDIELIEQRRKLELNNGIFTVTVYRRSTSLEHSEFVPVQSTPKVPNPRIPKYKGRVLNFVPFTFFGSSSNSVEPSKPPLLDLLNILKGHWRLTVAYQYGLHFAALPTACFAGFNFEEGKPIPLGPGAVHHTVDPNAKSWFLQTGGEGLASIEKGLDRLETQMAVVGARLLEEQRPGVESAETVRLRSSGDSSTLSDIAGNVEDGLSKVLKHVGFWLGVRDVDCHVSVNKDFVSTRLPPQDVTALLQAVQAGRISESTFLWNLQQGEILQQDRTIEDEQEAIGEDRIKNNINPSGAMASRFLTGTRV